MTLIAFCAPETGQDAGYEHGYLRGFGPEGTAGLYESSLSGSLFY